MSNTNRRCFDTLGRVLVTACGVLVGSPAVGFSVGEITYSPGAASFRLNGDPNHELVTADGLTRVAATSAAILSANGAKLTFHIEAVRTIQRANRQTDTQAIYDSSRHFDDEDGVLSSQNLIDDRALVLQYARAGYYLGAQEVLGRALHTLQDFYAHTTWIEHRGAEINPELGKSIVRMADRSEATCDQSGPLIPRTLSSGYFKEAQALGHPFYATTMIEAQAFGWPENKCAHGSSRYENHEHLGKGINKDNIKRVGFPVAMEAAAKSTAAFTNDIIGALRATGDDQAICGLLGREADPACRPSAWRIVFWPTGCLAPEPYNINCVPSLDWSGGERALWITENRDAAFNVVYRWRWNDGASSIYVPRSTPFSAESVTFDVPLHLKYFYGYQYFNGTRFVGGTFSVDEPYTLKFKVVGPKSATSMGGTYTTQNSYGQIVSQSFGRLFAPLKSATAITTGTWTATRVPMLQVLNGDPSGGCGYIRVPNEWRQVVISNWPSFEWSGKPSCSLMYLNSKTRVGAL